MRENPLKWGDNEVHEQQFPVGEEWALTTGGETAGGRNGEDKQEAGGLPQV